MASSHTVMHLQRKLKNLQQQRGEKGGSLESRTLGTVVPTMRSTMSGSPLTPPRDAHHSHRGVPLLHPMPGVLVQSLDGFVTDMRTLTKPENDPKDSTYGRGEVQSSARESILSGRGSSKPFSELLSLGRSVPVVSVPPSALAPDPWRSESTQNFSIRPSFGFVPPSAVAHPMGGYYFPRGTAANIELSPQRLPNSGHQIDSGPSTRRDVLCPLPGYLGAFTDSAMMSPSHQYPAYLPHVPIQPLFYRFDTSCLSYKKMPLQTSELSAFSPLHSFHPLPADPIAARPPTRRAGQHDSDAGRRRIKETIANHKGVESRLVADTELGFPQKKERRRQRVALGKAPGLEEDKQHKDMMDLSSRSRTSPQETQKGRRFRGTITTERKSVFIPEKSLHPIKDHMHSQNPPRVEAKLWNGFSRKDSETCSAQVDSGSCQRSPEPQNSLKALDLSPRYQQNKYRDEHKQMSSCTSRCQDPPNNQEAPIPPHGQVKERVLLPPRDGTSPRQGHRVVRSISMPNLLLMQVPLAKYEVFKAMYETGVSVKEAQQKEDLNSNRAPSQGGAKHDVRAPGSLEPAFDTRTLIWCIAETKQAEGMLQPSAERSENSTQEIPKTTMDRAGNSVSPAYISVCDNKELFSMAQHESPGAATIKPSQNTKRQLSEEADLSLQSVAQKRRSTAPSSPPPQNSIVGAPPLGGSEPENLYSTLLDLKPQLYPEYNEGHTDPACDLAKFEGQNRGEVQDLGSTGFSSEESMEMSPDHEKRWKPQWQGIEEILETYRGYAEESTGHQRETGERAEGARGSPGLPKEMSQPRLAMGT
ncbi:uncharacterized protein LOC125740567 isoform X2 [Brienomyrus brachyistius]|uniref:uncharacterized protein LOC125740567 isoform X2 n=1 Tax=Brienomyrus brachyistius TaxID=42636 RepID=UPI0020B319D0|nr:uncharacterized protein LOC125740567 isoform X2 [Brienomyrus brachyistius]